MKSSITVRVRVGGTGKMSTAAEEGRWVNTMPNTGDSVVSTWPGACDRDCCVVRTVDEADFSCQRTGEDGRYCTEEVCNGIYIAEGGFAWAKLFVHVVVC